MYVRLRIGLKYLVGKIKGNTDNPKVADVNCLFLI